jgi:tetratricopeptide (TPR) repeat protein
MLRIHTLAGALVFISGLATAPAAHAGDNAAAAEALFVQAKELTAKGNFADACPKFQASYKLDRTLGTLLNLADCHENVGKIASAWAEWGEAVEMAKKMGDDRSAFAAERRDALTPRLPKLTLGIPAPMPALDVYRDGVRIDPGAYNLALPVDPGPVTVAVRRGDKVLEQQQHTLGEAQQLTVPIDLVALDKRFPPAAPPKGGGAGGPDGRPDGGSQKTIGYVVGGVGVAAILTGVGFGIVALSKKSDADEPDACAERFCSNKGLDAADSAKSFAEIGQWIGIGGVVATAVGATLILTAPSTERAASQRRLTASPWISPSAGGFSVRGEL